MKLSITGKRGYNTNASSLLVPILLLMAFVAQAQQSLSLQEIRQLATEHNRKIAQAQYNIKAAEAVQAGTKGLNKPQIDGSVSAFHVGKPLSSLLPSVGVSPSLTVSQAIYAGGKIKLGQSAAAKGVEIYQNQKTLTETQVLLQAETAYWQIVSLKEKIGLTNRFIVLLDSLDQQLSNSFDAGLIYKNDLLRVRVQRNETALNLAKAEDGLMLAKLSLAQIIGMPGDVNYSINDSVSGTFRPLASEPLPGIAENRIEIQMLKTTMEAQQLQKEILKADFKPTVGLLFGGFTGVGKKMNFTTGENTLSSYFGMLSVSVPIWDWGQKASKVKEQSYRMDALQSQIDETKELLTLEVQEAYSKLNQSARRISLSYASVIQAEENLRLSTDRFAAGTVTGQDVLEAQTLWEQANSNIIDAKIAYKINEAAYRKAIGDIK
ncbi:outer membrane protein TolC [Dyadobacter jejuensis]|uniref:Outer membrane protein TolC n=1 Tax=Dyadobacter jejuensis TaxID=1082580 RepID=A0A316AL34_9BACT|nr:TolC family protein [Dyadobacter jejuensis]PWJ58251.1 outer membrane protein TolC [Dyadobacter jejuensis]